jgi:hypothetical protein
MWLVCLANVEVEFEAKVEVEDNALPPIYFVQVTNFLWESWLTSRKSMCTGKQIIE